VCEFISLGWCVGPIDHEGMRFDSRPFFYPLSDNNPGHTPQPVGAMPLRNQIKMK